MCHTILGAGLSEIVYDLREMHLPSKRIESGMAMNQLTPMNNDLK
ncbi:MAG: hypothetical protein RL213_1399 [Bacteroidota bacterium]